MYREVSPHNNKQTCRQCPGSLSSPCNTSFTMHNITFQKMVLNYEVLENSSKVLHAFNFNDFDILTQEWCEFTGYPEVSSAASAVTMASKKLLSTFNYPCFTSLRSGAFCNHLLPDLTKSKSSLPKADVA